MSDAFKIDQQLAHHQYLREQLAEKFPNEDAETLRDTVEGMTDLTDMLAELIRSSLDDKAFATALKQRMADMKERCDRFEVRAQKKRDLVWNTMERANINKIAVPDLTATIQASRSKVMVISESEIPPRYWTPQDPTLNRNKLSLALKAGKDIPGATLANTPPTLVVRTK